MFSGQGSHYYQMGRELFQQEPTFRKWLLDLDEVVREKVGSSVVEILYDKTHTVADPFERTLLTHPAIFMVEFALAQSLIEREVIPDYVMGTSLGSFAAATIAGCLEPQEALTAVIQQARVIEESCQRGGMIAILSSTAEYQDEALFANCEIAAFNFSSHFVVAAKRDRLDIIEAHLKRKGVVFQRLAVSHAFHSRWIDEAEVPFGKYLDTLSIKTPKIPVVCCARAQVFTNLPERYFWIVAREPIRFDESVTKLESSGKYMYVDAGPSGSLATFMKYLLSPSTGSQALPTMTPFARDAKNLESVKTLVSKMPTVSNSGQMEQAFSH
jgi:acyl transferase domain-containing protein